MSYVIFGKNYSILGENFMDEKFCKFCGEKIPADAVLCPKCGRQVEELKTSTTAAQPSIVINNANNNSNNK